MKLTRAQKVSLLKEISNLISYFETIDNMDVDKLINIMKEKYSSWKDANVKELYDDVNHVVTTLQNLIEGNVVKTTTGDVTRSNIEVEVTVTGSDVSTADGYLSSDLQVFEDENTLIEKDLDQFNDNTFTFTGFSTENFQDTNAITISPEEFWSDDESSSNDKEFN